MSVRKFVIVFKGIDSLPHTILVLNVSESLFIDIDLTKIVKQRYYGNALVGILKPEHFPYSIGFKIRVKALLNVY